MICRGQDQIMLRYGSASMIFFASTDIRFTISPDVEPFLAFAVTVRDFR